MHAFDYLRATSLEEAARALHSVNGAKLLAGGQTLIPSMKLGLASPPLIIDLSGIQGLARIERRGDTLVIGAMATHADIATSPVVASAIAGLCLVAAGIGDPHVRHRGTLGGAIANNDPAADYPAAALALNAVLRTNRRAVSSDDHFRGLFTAFEDDEILTEIAFPIPQRFAYVKFANPASRFALAGVAVAQSASMIRVAVTGAGAHGVFRVPAMEAALSQSFRPDALNDIAVESSRLLSDIHADAEYRAHLIQVMAKRAVAAALH